MLSFYEELGGPTVTKAVALQQAQRELISSKRFAHPFYWSPFLIIGNWL
jgi:CHAT domain-containing protein